MNISLFSETKNKLRGTKDSNDFSTVCMELPSRANRKWNDNTGRQKKKMESRVETIG